MIEVSVEIAGDKVRIDLVGSLDASVGGELDRLEKSIRRRRAVFSLSHLDHVNSGGVQVWTEFLGRLEGGYEFHACSVEFIDLLNLIPNLVGRGGVHSFYVPVECVGCRWGSSTLVMTAELGSFSPPPCESCGQSSVPCVPLEDFTQFLRRAGE